jgi:hypothetical protein
MNVFLSNPYFVAGIIAVVGIILAPIVRNVWMMRILISSYIALALVFLMPVYFEINIYSDIIYFFAIVFVFLIIERSRFFDVAEWSVGRFSFESVLFSMLTIFFLAAIICMLVPLQQLGIFMSADVYAFLNEYIFFIAIVPLVFSIIFSKRMKF